MFGKVIDVNENFVRIENIGGKLQLHLKGVHVVFEEPNRKVVGKITAIKSAYIEIFLIGEIINDGFIPGIDKAPYLNVVPRIVNSKELVTFLGNQNYQEKNTLLVGSSTIYDNFKITASLNDFFSNHFAIIGNSGYGKSCGAARILQNLFLYTQNPPRNMHMVMFDVYGEYEQAFSNLESISGVHVKSFKNEKEDIANVLQLPPSFLDADDLALLLNVEDPYLIPILEKTLQFVSIFKSEDPASLEYKNNIIATSLLEVLSSGKDASQIRDQIMSILNKYNTSNLNIDSEIKEPGYTRTIRQCLNIDNQGKINAISQVIDYLNQFKKMNLKEYALVPNLVYSLEDIYDALEFALLSEGVYNNVSMYERATSLKIHLHQIINGPNKKFFEYQGVISKKEYVEGLFQSPNGENIQIVNINLNTLEDRFAKILTKLYSKLFFDYATNSIYRGSFPIHIILEEAHRYVTRDRDIDVIGYNIFDRITKEGRKYGILMGFITQRPSELSETALSQCSNFLVFRIFHPDDYKIIDAITSSITRDDLERLKTLRKGMCLAFGSAFHIPLIAKLDMPNPAPASSNVDISNLWFS